jgi:hypothetical protein
MGEEEALRIYSSLGISGVQRPQKRPPGVSTS